MKKILLISLIAIIQLGLIGSIGYLGYSNYQINKQLKTIDSKLTLAFTMMNAMGNDINYKDYDYEIRKIKEELANLRYHVGYLRAEDADEKLNRLLKR